MRLSEWVKNAIQKYGAGFSRVVFTERNLESNSARWCYIRMYDVFKWLFERQEMREIAALARKGSTVLDMGANTGWTAMHFARAVGPSGRVLAFEPDPVARGIGQYRTKDMANIVWFPCALGGDDGELIFHQNLSNRADNRVVNDPETMLDTKEITVPVRSLSSLADDLPELFKDVSLIKMDVQGYEDYVLSGMAAWLRGLPDRPILTFEWWPYGLKKAGTEPFGLLSRLSSLGYRVPEKLKNVDYRLAVKDDGYLTVTLMAG